MRMIGVYMSLENKMKDFRRLDKRKYPELDGYSDNQIYENMIGVGYFYRAVLGEKITEPIETDHALIWHNIDEAVKVLFLDHQKWAVLNCTL